MIIIYGLCANRRRIDGSAAKGVGDRRSDNVAFSVVWRRQILH